MKRILWLCALAACVDKGAGPSGKKIDTAVIAQNLLTAPPADLKHIDVPLGGGAVIYLGSAIDKQSVAPGGSVRIVHFWKVVKPPGPDWRVFAQVRGAPNTADFMALPASDIEQGHPVSAWKAGEIIQDVHDVVLRPDWKSPQATFLVGLVHVGGHDVGDRMAAPPGPNVVDRAVVAKVIDVDLSKAPPPQGTIYVPHAAQPVVIDGFANDPAWATAAASPEFVTAEGSPDPVGRATAKLTWDEDNLYLLVQVQDTDIFSPYKNHDDTLWKADDVEIFIDADGNRRGYVELQVNPNNATFDSWFAGTRAQPGDPTWDSNMKTAVKVRGTPDKEGDTDQGWDAEVAIPWAAVKGRDTAMAVRTPPQVGDRWKLNVVRVDIKTGGANSPSASSWNRITYQDWHSLDRMLTAVFADQTGSIVPRPAPPPPPPEASGSAAGSGSAAAAGAPRRP